MNSWVTSRQENLPDFIISGAMKCGTTTVHSILSQFPGVYIPKSEINFFDIDDIMQHSDFFFERKPDWVWPEFEKNPNLYWDWYFDFFKDAPAGSLRGEDSTCYLPSENAATRIAQQGKPIKTIICLRHPTRRAYSQYWHMLRTGRALFSFEKSIQYTPSDVLTRSLYRPQIERFLRSIPREQVYFFVLEEFLADKKTVVKEMADFLGLDLDRLPAGAFDTHANKGKIPMNVGLQALKNRLLRNYGSESYLDLLPFEVEKKRNSQLFSKLLHKSHNLINPSLSRTTPAMKPETKRFLDSYFEKESRGLDELIGKDVSQLWFKDK